MAAEVVQQTTDNHQLAPMLEQVKQNVGAMPQAASADSGYWNPKQPLAAGSETFFAYRQFWCWNPPEQPPLAIATQSRSGRVSSSKRRRFMVEFAGAMLRLPQDAEAMKPNLNASPGSLIALRTFTSVDKKSCRILFELGPGNEAFSELRLVIEAAGKPISETWLYRWTL